MDAAFHNAVAAGVTSVMAGPGSSNVVGGQFAFIKCDGRDVDKMVVKAPCAMKVALGENPKTCYGSNGNMPQTRMGIAALLRRELFRARAYCEKRRAARAGGAPCPEDPGLECWMPVFSGEIPLKAHVHRADDILTLIRIAREFELSATLDHCTDGHLIADAIRESGFPAIVGPSLASRSKIEVARLDFKTAGVLFHAGVKVALTMDHPVSLIQYLPVAAALAAKEGLGEAEALRAITANAADICRVQDRIGRIKEGLDADIAVFDRHPLDIRARAMMTLIGGKIVYDRTRDEDDGDSGRI